jgi:uncharacterized phage protein (TIGR02218 family)
MSRVYFRSELEPVATFWRIERQDGVALGFTSHNRDLWFDGLLHRAAPGMLPSAIRRDSSLNADNAEVSGALTHDAITASDLEAGRYDSARIAIGLVDWETLEHDTLYRGEVGAIGEDAGSFATELRSAKSVLSEDNVPRTSPTCRAQFCGRSCTLSATRFTHEATVASIDFGSNRAVFTGGPFAANMLNGHVRWLDGPHAGVRMEVVGVEGPALEVDQTLDQGLRTGMRAQLREGCDHTLDTCVNRFANSVNFQGEPFLPGNDLLAHYPVSSAPAAS